MFAPITLDFTLDANAYGRLMQRLAFRRQMIIIGIIIGSVMLYNLLTDRQRFWDWLLPTALFVVFFLFFTRILARRAFKVTTNLHPALHYVFSEEKVSVSTAEVENSYDWEAFHHVREMPDWFLLYQNKLVFNPIPKSAFTGETQMEDLRSLLRSKKLL